MLDCATDCELSPRRDVFQAIFFYIMANVACLGVVLEERPVDEAVIVSLASTTDRIT